MPLLLKSSDIRHGPVHEQEYRISRGRRALGRYESDFERVQVPREPHEIGLRATDAMHKQNKVTR